MLLLPGLQVPPPCHPQRRNALLWQGKGQRGGQLSFPLNLGTRHLCHAGQRIRSQQLNANGDSFSLWNVCQLSANGHEADGALGPSLLLEVF